jgi:hypothetical protein
MTPQQIQAIKQHMAKPERLISACGCMGPQVIDPTGPRGKYGWIEGPQYPVCPCAMQDIEEVEGKFYTVGKEQRELGSEYIATDIGVVGGPYTIGRYGEPGYQEREVFSKDIPHIPTLQELLKAHVATKV